MNILTKFLNPVSLFVCFFLDTIVGMKGPERWEDGQTVGQRLASDVMSNYSKLVRPVTNPNLPVDVHMRMNLYQLLDVNEPNQKIQLYAWVTQITHEERHEKACNPCSSYKSLDVNRVSTERWISVIYSPRQAGSPGGEEGDQEETFGESSNEPKDSGEKNEEGRFVADGIFQYPAIYTFTCKMNIRLFPFDLQRCIMTFSSWTHDSSGIDYHLKDDRQNVTFESYTENEEWIVKEFNFRRKPIHYDCCPIPYTLLEAELVIQRKPLYYITNLVIPTTIITLIAVVGFFMPASTNGERTEKISLGITTLLAMSILLLMVSDQMPTTSDYIPLMGWYFLLIIFIISIGTFTTSIIILIHSRGNSGIPPSRALIGAFHRIGACLWVGQTKEYQRVTLKKRMTMPYSMTMTTTSSSTSHNLIRPGGDALELDKNGNPTIVPSSKKQSIETMKDGSVEIPLLNLNDGEDRPLVRRSSIRSCRGDGEHHRRSSCDGSSSQFSIVDYIDASFQTHSQLMALAASAVARDRVGTTNPGAGYCNDQCCTTVADCMRQNNHNKGGINHQHQMNQATKLGGAAENSEKKPRPNTLSKSTTLRRTPAAPAPLASMEATPASLSSSLILQLMCDILNTLRTVQSALASASDDNTGRRQNHHKTGGIIMLEWAYICAVLDRICLILFTMIVLTLTSTTILYGWLCRDWLYANHEYS